MRTRAVPIVGGAYADESRAWSAQDVCNWLPAQAEAGETRTPSMFKTPPGLRPFVEAGSGAVRGVYNCEGRLFVVIGSTFYRIGNAGVAVPIGTIPGVGRVGFAHNQITGGNELLVVNGSAGYVFNTVTSAFGRITDTGYPGGIRPVFLDGYLVDIEPGRRFAFHSDLADATEYNTMDRFTSEVSPDMLVSLAASNNELLLLSENTCEFFENTGAAQQPFRSKRITMDVGCAGTHAVATMDNTVFWLGSDGRFYLLNGYSPQRISTRPIEQSIRGLNWSQAFAFVWEDSGHSVCYWTFPDGRTWGYDASTGQWHRRSSYGFNRWRVSALTFWRQRWIAGDFQHGRLWELDWDYILEGDTEIVSERTTGFLQDNQNRVTVPRLELMFATGQEETMPVPFPTQPDGPEIYGEAPDSLTGDPYSFAYTPVAGDSPIARTVLVDTTLPTGWVWNESTATISHAGGVPSLVSISLKMRTFDQNGLWADHEDAFMIAEKIELLVTGSPKTGGGPAFAKAVATSSPEFAGIPQSSGADVSGMSPAFHGGTWCAITSEAVRYSVDAMSSWQTGSIAAGGEVAPIVGLDSGWVAIRQNEDVSSVYTSGPTPSVFTNQPSLPSEQTNGSPGDARSSSILFSANDEFILVRNKATCALFSSDSINGPYVALWDRNAEAVAGRDPNGECIIGWYDLAYFDGHWCALITWNFNEGLRRYKIIRSPSLDDWTTFDVLVDLPSGSADRPAQLCATEDAVVAYCSNGKLWSSANGWASPITTGLSQTAGGNEHAVALFGGRRVVAANRLFYCIGNTDTLVVYDPVTQEVSAPITLPISNAVGIACGGIGDD